MGPRRDRLPIFYTAARVVKQGARLRDYYDWPRFQKQMEYTGVANQLGGYIPQTPLTMLPLVALADFNAQTAKRVWRLMNVVFLAVSLWLLAGRAA